MTTTTMTTLVTMTMTTMTRWEEDKEEHAERGSARSGRAPRPGVQCIDRCGCLAKSRFMILFHRKTRYRYCLPASSHFDSRARPCRLRAPSSRRGLGATRQGASPPRAPQMANWLDDQARASRLRILQRARQGQGLLAKETRFPIGIEASQGPYFGLSSAYSQIQVNLGFNLRDAKQAFDGMWTSIKNEYWIRAWSFNKELDAPCLSFPQSLLLFPRLPLPPFPFLVPSLPSVPCFPSCFILVRSSGTQRNIWRTDNSPSTSGWRGPSRAYPSSILRQRTLTRRRAPPLLGSRPRRQPLWRLELWLRRGQQAAA